MGELSRSVHRNRGVVLGIIPKHLLEIEGINKNHGEVVITDDMHIRKKQCMIIQMLFYAYLVVLVRLKKYQKQ